MMQPKSFFMGLVVIPAYGYNCVMTNAQLELIAIDKSVSYIKRDKSKNGKGNSLSKPSNDKVQDAIDRFNARQSKK